MATRLPLPGGSLVFDATENWCAVWLEVGSERRHLGSYRPEVIRHCLLAHLAEPREAVGEVDGDPVHWVMSLAEPHCALYAQFGPEGRRLLIQGPQCEWLWRGPLPEPEWRAWQIALTNPAEPGDAPDPAT